MTRRECISECAAFYTVHLGLASLTVTRFANSFGTGLDQYF
jgi:hypothetical protein